MAGAPLETNPYASPAVSEPGPRIIFLASGPEADPFSGRFPPVGIGFEQDAPPLFEHLSKRELDVLRLMVRGRSNSEISEALMISLNTTKKHVSNIFGKMDVSCRSQAIRRARELSLVSEA